MKALGRETAVAIAALVVGFLVLSPGPLVDAGPFWAGFQYQRSLASHPYDGQEAIPSVWFHARTLAIALGPIGLVAALVGLALVARRRAGPAVAAFPFASFLVFLPMKFAFARLDVPVLPALALGAGVAVAHFCKRTSRSVAAVVLSVVFVLPALVSVRIDSLLRARDTRADAEQWLVEHASEKPRLAFDPIAYRGCLPLGASGNRDENLPEPYMRPLDDPSLVERFRQAGVRYVVIGTGEDDPSPGMRETLATLEKNAKLCFHVEAGRAGEHVPYASEERYAPFEHVFARERPGPGVRIFELTR